MTWYVCVEGVADREGKHAHPDQERLRDRVAGAYRRAAQIMVREHPGSSDYYGDEHEAKGKAEELARHTGRCYCVVSITPSVNVAHTTTIAVSLRTETLGGAGHIVVGPPTGREAQS